MSRAASPFSPRVVLGMLLVGAAAFVLFLYALGAGWTGGDRSTGSGHAASKALNGYAALYELLGKRGHEVSLSRNRGRLDTDSLLVLTPSHFQDPDDLAKLIAQRRMKGPTLLILPKWYGFDASRISGVKGARRGWVILGDAESPDWAGKIGLGKLSLSLDKAAGWRGNGHAGKLPDPAQVQALKGSELAELVKDDKGRMLAGYRNDGGYYRKLEDFADGAPPPPPTAPMARPETGAISVQVTSPAPDQGASDDEDDGADDSYNPADDYWPLVIVADPDLVNNSGLADPDRARLAVELVDAAIDGYDLPIVFDLTLPGLGQHENLLTLAFEPPFLAATLILLLAMLVAGWRGFVRFGPSRAELPELAGGKAQLARDGAMLVERARRLALVGPPYAALIGKRLSRALGLPERSTPGVRGAAIARALARRGEDPDAFARASEDLRQARRPAELLRAAKALNSIERTLRR